MIGQRCCGSVCVVAVVIDVVGIHSCPAVVVLVLVLVLVTLDVVVAVVVGAVMVARGIGVCGTSSGSGRGMHIQNRTYGWWSL